MPAVSSFAATDAHPPRKSQILSWALWDWGAAAFHAVMLTFVFSVYLTGTVAKEWGEGVATSRFSLMIGLSGLVIAIFAPVTGQRADAGGRRRLSLGIWSLLVISTMLGCFFVKDQANYFWLGAGLLGIASIFASFAEVSYSAMLRQVSTPATIGRVSGFGWSMGYFGGIFLLIAVYYGFVKGGDTPGVAGFLGLSTEGGYNIRMVAVTGAVWFAIFALPLMFTVPETPPAPKERRVGFFASYRLLVRDLRELWRIDRNAVFFLLASALFRDGLAAIFTIGAILANKVYGLSPDDILIFGIAANIVAALGALTSGYFDDKVGPKAVIMFSLICLFSAGLILVFVSGPTMFWIFGLMLTAFVGPAQTAARTFLGRVAPVGKEGEMFGLYTTTGRAVSFLAPTLASFFAGVFHSDRMNILGILIVLGLGLLAMLFVKPPVDRALVDPTPTG